MRNYELVVRDGTVVDGSGMPSFRADVGVIGGRIASIGRIRERGEQEIDAEGHVVAPGFIDGHTHMDAQVMWDPLGSCSCWHGVTTVVMGNCGFTLAPAKPDARDLVVRNLERAEDISADALAKGVTWSWETFPEYLDTIDRLDKGINYAGFVGHSALRTWAMGERAFEEKARPEDLDVMVRELNAALRAGAIGLSTSRAASHKTMDDHVVASRVAGWDEVRALVGAMGDAGGGIFEIANDHVVWGDDHKSRETYLAALGSLAIDTGCPTTFGVASFRPDGADVDWLLKLLDETAAAGGRMFGQAHCRQFSIILSWKSTLPFDRLAEWQSVRDRPLDEQRRLLLDPSVRDRLIRAARDGDYGASIGTETRAPLYEHIMIMDRAMPPWRSVNDLAAERRLDPVDLMIDLALASDFDQLFLQTTANLDDDNMVRMLKHPRCLPTFTDSGAHVSQIMDASLQTHFLGYWSREREQFSLEEAVRRLTFEQAQTWGFWDRGLLRQGMAADLCIFDPATIGPALPTVHNDLPGGAQRLIQTSDGIRSTVVNGHVYMVDNEHTGVLAGQLLRRPLAGQYGA